MHSALRLNLFSPKSAPTVNLTLTRRLWMGFALMALLTLTSTYRWMVQPALYQPVEKDNTQALIPTMNMARQLSEASARELSPRRT